VSGEPAAFMSYGQFDEDDDDGEGLLSQFRRRLAAEVRAQTGHDFTIFQDREDIAYGENWQQRIDETLDAAALLLVIITPGLFRSEASRAEISRFLQRERQLGRSDLILPVYYITAREIEAPAAQRVDPLAKVLTSRQYVDWRNMRFEPVTSPLALRTIADLASRMTSAFWRSPPLPPSPPSLGQPGSGDGRPPRPAAGPTFQPAAEPDPYAWLARNDQQGNNQEWIPLHQRSWRQPSQPFRRPTGSQAAPAQVPCGNGVQTGNDICNRLHLRPALPDPRHSPSRAHCKASPCWVTSSPSISSCSPTRSGTKKATARSTRNVATPDQVSVTTMPYN